VFVDETQGATLTLPDYPGFSLTVAPDSATFPDGTRRGTLSVTAVHVDKVPMVPNFGQQPRFIVTIQPPGVRFDPPAQVTHPNVDGLAPGEITEIYSFDHDMGSFVATGTATVSADGLVLRSDPGMGVVKGGWHCGGNPTTPGTPHDCPDCTKCDPVKQCCVADASKNGSKCKDKASNREGLCRNGKCDTCPESTSVASQTAVTIEDFWDIGQPALLAGGIVAKMKVGPGNITWDGAQISEELYEIPGTNTCGRLALNPCVRDTNAPWSRARFTVGAAAISPFPRIPTPAEKNIFYDFHLGYGLIDALGQMHRQSCEAQCLQIYKCGGIEVGRHTLLWLFTHSQFRPLPELPPMDVTRVVVVKQ
jgi:hypothetical protein